ncbi:unnamed protein product, partial [Heterosigma akashiwo]
AARAVGAAGAGAALHRHAPGRPGGLRGDPGARFRHAAAAPEPAGSSGFTCVWGGTGRGIQQAGINIVAVIRGERKERKKRGPKMGRVSNAAGIHCLQQQKTLYLLKSSICPWRRQS